MSATEPQQQPTPQTAAPEPALPVTSNFRLMMVLLSICTAFVGLAVYSVYIHISHRTELNRFGENRLIRSIKEPALRGMITDRDGTVLAVSRHLRVPTFNPQAIYEPKRKGDPVNWQTISDEQFRKMAEILQIPENELKSKFQDTSVKYLNLKKELSLAEADALKALKIPSLRFEERSERSYPTGNLFSHIVGFANSKGVGLEGIERTENERLKGEDGKQIVIRDRHGNIVELLDSPENTMARSGKTLVLSVNQEIQRIARSELSKGLKQFNAKAGGVVVLDAKTGEILAMTSLPDYDANFYTQFPEDSFRNYAVGVTMEPGSVMKPFIVAKAIDDGKIGRHTQFDTRPYPIGRKLIQDTHEYPSLTSEGILQKSSNVGTSKIAAMYPNNTLYQYFNAIGFGRKTNSGVSGEQSSPLKPPQQWGQLDKAVMSYGYALTANMLQMAQAYTIFTNDGKLLPATIYKRDNAPAGAPVIRPATAKILRDMMISVTRPGGSGINGAVPGYDVAGKTGTAKKVSESGGYEDRYRASFVGFAPAHQPRLIIAVTIDDPRGKGYYGGAVAGPVFRNVMAGSLKVLNVKPTHDVSDEEAQIPVEQAVPAESGEP